MMVFFFEFSKLITSAMHRNIQYLQIFTALLRQARVLFQTAACRYYSSPRYFLKYGPRISIICPFNRSPVTWYFLLLRSLHLLCLLIPYHVPRHFTFRTLHAPHFLLNHPINQVSQHPNMSRDVNNVLPSVSDFIHVSFLDDDDRPKCWRAVVDHIHELREINILATAREKYEGSHGHYQETVDVEFLPEM